MNFVINCLAALRGGRRPGAPDERGASVIEYALLLALIAVVCVVAVEMIGGSTSDSLSSTADLIP